jgi:glutamate formiminotransferase / formiminotetrahydrofolate cyclodeaminase
LKCVRGLGWWLEESNLAQISVNLTDFEITNIHTAYNQCVSEAEMLNIGVCGSQIVGLIPLRPLLIAADYYIQKENLFILDEDQKIRLVIQRLGLNSISPFNPKDRIIEYIIREREGHDDSVNTMEIRELVKHVGARTLVPGGSCVTSLVATLGTALGTMCALLTYGMRKVSEAGHGRRYHASSRSDMASGNRWNWKCGALLHHCTQRRRSC